MPSSTVEDYLKCIWQLEQDSGRERVGTGQISQALGVVPGTATAMIKTLSDRDLVAYEPYAGVKLTHEGRQLALHVLRRHRLIELFLVQIMGMEWSQVHSEAERLEHVVSEALVERIDEMLEHPVVDPHGDPIPSAAGQLEESEAANLLTAPLQKPLEVVRVSDQRPEFLRLLDKHGVQPGRRLQVLGRSEPADTVELEMEGEGSVSIGRRAAMKIFVRAAQPATRA